mgnify:CR=1 FL=1
MPKGILTRKDCSVNAKITISTNSTDFENIDFNDLMENIHISLKYILQQKNKRFKSKLQYKNDKIY